MAPAQAHRLIDKEVGCHEKRLAELTSLRHSLPPITLLPEELLLEIFRHVQKGAPLKEWHQITHVCRYWRHVAVGASVLWTNPVCKPSHYIPLFIQRSGTADLNFNFDEKVKDDVLDALMGEMYRTRSIIMDYGSPLALQFIQARVESGMVKPPTRLRELGIRVLQRFGLPPAYYLSSTTFGDLTSLQTLRLSGIGLHWNTLPLPKLTTLLLRNVKPRDPLTWQQFLRTLSDMPLLQDLQVTMDSLDLRTLDESISAIQLPDLRSLCLAECDFSIIPYVLSHMIAPNLTRAAIRCAGGPPSENTDYSEVAQHLSSLMADTGDSDVSLDISTFSYTVTFTEGERRPITLSHPIQYDSWGEELLHYEGFTAHGIQTLISTISTRRIVRLKLNVLLTADEMKALFGTLPRLTVVKVYDEGARNFPAAFAIPPSHPADAPIPFKFVRSLTLGEYGDDHDVWECPYMEEFWEGFREALMMRYEYGSPIHHVTVGCREFKLKCKGQMDTLREIVPDVRIRYPRRYVDQGPWEWDDLQDATMEWSMLH